MDSRCLSAGGVRFLSPPLPAAGFRRSCVGRTGVCQTASGLPCSATMRYDRVECHLYPGTVVSLIPDRGVGILYSAEGGSRASWFTTPSLSVIIRRLGDIGASSMICLRSSVRSFPCLWRPDDGLLLGVSFHFTPRRYQRRMGRWEWAWDTRPGMLLRASRSSASASCRTPAPPPFGAGA